MLLQRARRPEESGGDHQTLSKRQRGRAAAERAREAAVRERQLRESGRLPA